MANVTRDRSSQPYASTEMQPYFGGFGLAVDQKIYGGCMYNLDSSGRPKNPGSTAETVMGVAHKHYDNTGGAQDAIKIDLHSGCHAMDLHATHPPTVADIGSPGYASDNHTISRLSSDGSYAGVIVWVDSALVYVWFSPFGPANAFAGFAGVAAITGALTGVTDGAMVDVAAGVPATAGGATPTAAQVDTGINNAIGPLVTSINLQMKELQVKVNAIIAALA